MKTDLPDRREVSSQDGTQTLLGVIPVRNIYLGVKLIHPRSSKDPPRHIVDTGQPDTVIPNSYYTISTHILPNKIRDHEDGILSQVRITHILYREFLSGMFTSELNVDISKDLPRNSATCVDVGHSGDTKKCI